MKKLALFLLALGCLILVAACTITVSGPSYYPRILIETYCPTQPVTGPAFDSRITFYDGAGNLLEQADQAGDFELLEYLGGLYPGTYYIKVEGSPGKFANTGAYAVRALSLNLGESPPSYIVFGSISADPDPYEDDSAVGANGMPLNPATLPLDEALNRYISMPADTDVDWMVLVLP